MDIVKEKEYLNRTLDTVADNLSSVDSALANSGEELLKERAEIWDSTYEIDEIEQSTLETNAQLKGDAYINLLLRKGTLEKQADSPYWGKINYTPNGLPTEDLYIGLSSLADRHGNILVVDWRAPVANVYYNFELGNTEYVSPSGAQKGVVNYKYQFKIEKGTLKFVIDTQTTITDEVLMRELAKNATPVMKNIAATIQREQNEIIRLNFGKNLLVQGVAGSGKTSIALHRIAYLLYNARDTIRAKEILIISPNKAFSGYISHVLPELGEENVVQLGMEDIAKQELKDVTSFENRSAYLEKLYDGETLSQEVIADLKYKASEEFVLDLQRYISKLEKKVFKGRNFKVGDYECGKDLFEKMFFQRFASYPWLVRMRKIVEYVETDLSRYFHNRINAKLHYKVTENLFVMYRRYATVELYRYILERLKEEGKPVIVPEKDDVLPFRDVYGLLYLRIKTEGTTLDYGKYKMVTVDEMQDYFPIQYAVINHLFNCPKTILGDLNQIVDPYMNIGSLENMQKLLGEHEFRRLTTSYRSSKEITEFANRLVTEKVNPIDRHEEPPEIVKCGSFDEEAKEIDREIDRAYQEKGYGSLAIIARNKSQAQRLADKLRNKVTVLLDTDRAYRGGTVITTALIVKGFEFDEVIVLDADEENYSTESEKRILYVTVTRALHSVKFYHVGELSHFLK